MSSPKFLRRSPKTRQTNDYTRIEVLDEAPYQCENGYVEPEGSDSLESFEDSDISSQNSQPWNTLKNSTRFNDAKTPKLDTIKSSDNLDDLERIEINLDSGKRVRLNNHNGHGHNGHSHQHSHHNHDLESGKDHKNCNHGHTGCGYHADHDEEYEYHKSESIGHDDIPPRNVLLEQQSSMFSSVFNAITPKTFTPQSLARAFSLRPFSKDDAPTPKKYASIFYYYFNYKIKYVKVYM